MSKSERVKQKQESLDQGQEPKVNTPFPLIEIIHSITANWSNRNRTNRFRVPCIYVLC